MASRSSPPGAGQDVPVQSTSLPASQPAGRQQPAGRTRDPLTRGLGWASAGLGLPQLVAPRWFNRAIGVGEGTKHQATTAIVGVRELAAAAALLTSESPVWLWARVVGDLMDLGLLGAALASHDRRGMGRTVAATAAVAGITGADLYAAVTRSQRKTEMGLTASVTVVKSPQEAYDQWRQLESLPLFMAHLDEVRPTGNGTTHWRASAPFGRSVEWDAEIIEDVAGERIAWRSVGDPDVPNDGEVRFRAAPGGRGTEIHVTLRYWVPGGKLGAAVARYFGEDPHQQLDDDLRRFKQIVETGEVVRSEGAPGGKRARREFPQHPARPLSESELQEARS
ncbi:MAG: SRPBCC family protein [Streptosporangiaceae bacterium]